MKWILDSDGNFQNLHYVKRLYFQKCDNEFAVFAWDDENRIELEIFETPGECIEYIKKILGDDLCLC